MGQTAVSGRIHMVRDAIGLLPEKRKPEAPQALGIPIRAFVF